MGLSNLLGPFAVSLGEGAANCLDDRLQALQGAIESVSGGESEFYSNLVGSSFVNKEGSAYQLNFKAQNGKTYALMWFYVRVSATLPSTHDRYLQISGGGMTTGMTGWKRPIIGLKRSADNSTVETFPAWLDINRGVVSIQPLAGQPKITAEPGVVYDFWDFGFYSFIDK